MRELRDIKYYLRNRFVNKTHLVELTKLEKGQWCDTDTRIFEACFELLKFYVEKDRTLEGLEEECNMDNPENLVDEDYSEMLIDQANRARRVRELYYWYLRHTDAWEAHDTDAVFEEENKKLHELIDLRTSLWT
jgi:hypothetical protein